MVNIKLEAFNRLEKAKGKEAMQQLQDMRVPEVPGPDDPLIWKVECDWANEWIKYTTVHKLSLRNDRIVMRNVTSCTRLHVPISEVHDCSLVHTVGGDGPYKIHHREKDGSVVLLSAATQGMNPGPRVLKPWDHVSVEFFFSPSEGVVAGKWLMSPVETLNKRLGWKNVEKLANGCKFDLWAHCCLGRGFISVFAEPSVNSWLEKREV